MSGGNRGWQVEGDIVEGITRRLYDPNLPWWTASRAEIVHLVTTAGYWRDIAAMRLSYFTEQLNEKEEEIARLRAWIGEHYPPQQSE